MDLDIKNIYGNRPYTNRSTYFTSVYDGAFYYEIHHDSNSGIGGKRVEKVCSSFDVLPTLLDLLGVDFNMNLYQGQEHLPRGDECLYQPRIGHLYQHLYFDSETLYMDAERQGKRAIASLTTVRSYCIRTGVWKRSSWGA